MYASFPALLRCEILERRLPQWGPKRKCESQIGTRKRWMFPIMRERELDASGRHQWGLSNLADGGRRGEDELHAKYGKVSRPGKRKKSHADDDDEGGGEV